MPGCVNPTPVPQWEPSLLSLQGWDSIPSREGNRAVTAFLPLLYRLADATLQYSQFKCRVCCQCAADGFGYYVSMGYLYCLWGFSAMEGQAEILMNYLSHQVLVNDLSQIQFPVYKEGC